MLRVLLIVFLIVKTNSLIPKRLPNGKPLLYEANKLNPSSDLKIINPGQASIITRNWLQNIVVEMVQRENKNLVHQDFSKKGLYDYDDLHIVMNINKLESYIQESYELSRKKTPHLFMAWMPRGVYGRNDTLFIIVATIDAEKKEFGIRHMVQSPFWDPEQIDSDKLRLALLDQNEKNNCTTINLEYLYEHDLRYKLAWATWNLHINEEDKNVN